MMLLILDLDETLLYATKTPLGRSADFTVGSYSIYKRPHVDRFLDQVSGWFDLAIWTSAGDVYAAEAVTNLFGSRSADFVFLWTSERCTRCFNGETLEQYFVKDLKKVKRQGYDLSRVIVMDDTPIKYERNYGNLVRVTEYTGAEEDDELLRALDFLDWLRKQPDVRVIEKRWWRKYQVREEGS